jgi:pimeloyl-ACP methyl ester carboxylesterase
MRVRLSDGARLFVDVLGPKLRPAPGRLDEVPTMVTVHGGPGSDHSAMRPFVGRFADACQVVVYDQRGMGRSDHGTPADWTLARWTQDLHELLDVLGIERPVLLGQSFGGYVALSVAADRPDDIAALILSSSQAAPTPRDSIERFRALGGDEPATAAERFFAALSPATFEEYRRLCFPLYNRTPRDPELDERQIDTWDVLFHFWSGEYRSLDLRPRLASVRAPTLVIAGEGDPIISAERSVRLAEGLTNAARVGAIVIPEAGHGPYRDAPEEFDQAVRDFLASVVAPAIPVP